MHDVSRTRSSRATQKILLIFFLERKLTRHESSESISHIIIMTPEFMIVSIVCTSSTVLPRVSVFWNPKSVYSNRIMTSSRLKTCIEKAAFRSRSLTHSPIRKLIDRAASQIEFQISLASKCSTRSGSNCVFEILIHSSLY